MMAVHKSAEQIVTGVGPPLGDDRHHVGLKLLLGLKPLSHDVLVAGEVAEEQHYRVVPLLEPLMVRLVEPQHVDDHVDREADGELVDQIHLAVGAEAVDEVAGVGRNDGYELGRQLAAPECGSNQVPVGGVVAALHLEDGPAVDRLKLPLVVLRGERLVLEGPLHAS